MRILLVLFLTVVPSVASAAPEATIADLSALETRVNRLEATERMMKDRIMYLDERIRDIQQKVDALAAQVPTPVPPTP